MSDRGVRQARRLRRRDALHGWSMHFGPNMTPMVDVVMVILVFFMASAAFVGTDWFLRTASVAEGGGKGANASGARPTDLQQVVNVSLDIGASGRTVGSMLELTGVPLAELLARINAMPKGKQTEELRVIVRPTQAVPYSDVVRVHAAFHNVGVNQVGLGAARAVGSTPAPAGP